MNALIERRAREASKAQALEDLWKASERRHHERLRRERRAEWYCYWSALADSLRRSADEFEAKAEALLEGGER